MGLRLTLLRPTIPLIATRCCASTTAIATRGSTTICRRRRHWSATHSRSAGTSRVAGTSRASRAASTASTMSETVQSFGFGLEGSLGQRWSAGPFFFGLEYAALFVPMYAGTGHRTARLSSRTYPNGRFEIDRETKVSRAPELRFMNIELGLRF